MNFPERHNIEAWMVLLGLETESQFYDLLLDSLNFTRLSGLPEDDAVRIFLASKGVRLDE